MSDNSDFFKHQTPSSKIKATIISEYFPQYCSIISRKHIPKKFGYFDMFAGPGRYEDGSLSTPLLVAKACYDRPDLLDRVWMVFNDMAFGDKLKENFEAVFESGTFPNEPFFANRTFGEWPKIDSFLTRNTMEGFYNECPTVLFIDPWGYKHINTQVLAKFLNFWGNEVFIFVNTKRLNAAFENDLFLNDLKIVFPTTFEEVKENKSKIKGSPQNRHTYIIQQLAKEFRQLMRGYVYYTSFEFQEENQDTPSHYLLHITKGSKGFELIKQVYSKYSNVPRTLGEMGDVMTYAYDPKRIDGFKSLFDNEFQEDNINRLKKHLMTAYAGKTINAEKMFNEHQKKYLHSKTHYLQALRSLVEEKKITVKYTDGRNHKASVLISNFCDLTFQKNG